MIKELTLAVVGIDISNADGRNRRSEAMITLPGEPVELIPEPRNKHDRNAIAVVSPRGVQIGYLSAERAPYVHGRMSRGDDAVAIFQGINGGAAFIRIRFDGATPTLPNPADYSAASRDLTRSSRSPEHYDPDAFTRMKTDPNGRPEQNGTLQSGAEHGPRVTRLKGWLYYLDAKADWLFWVESGMAAFGANRR